MIIHEGRGEDEEPFGNDAASLVTRHDRDESSFWIEREGRSLTVNHVVFGAEGFLRRLVVEADEELDGLAAAVAALPALEELVVFGPAVLDLPPLRSSTLRRISLGMRRIDYDDEALPPGWSARLAAALARCELPALQSANIDVSVDVYTD